MGLDGAEIVVDTEKRFGIEFTTETDGRLETCGTFHQQIVHLLIQDGRMRFNASDVQPDTWTEDQVWYEIQKIVSRVLDVPMARITKDAHFVKDLGLS